MPYRLRDRRTQEDWNGLRALGALSEEEIARARAAGFESWCPDDLKFLREIGALDWSLAGSLMFQGFISEFGSPEEQARLENLNVGFRRLQ
jgi:hypothetical protein